MKLLALTCPRCATPLIPDNDDIVTLCPECQTAIQISDEGLSEIEISYATPSPEKTNILEWQPFWIFTGQVTLQKRETQGGSSSDQQMAELFWTQPRRFYVPAWDTPLHTAQGVGSRLLQQQPLYTAGPQPSGDINLLPVVVTFTDALKLTEFIILSLEAQRSDWLTNLQFTLTPQAPQLWALPG